MKLLAKIGASIGALLLAGQAAAVSVVDAGVTAQITDTQGDIVTVGGAIIGLAVVSMGVRWVKATFF